MRKAEHLSLLTSRGRREASLHNKKLCAALSLSFAKMPSALAKALSCRLRVWLSWNQNSHRGRVWFQR